MAEKKTRILLRSDILANWLSVDPVLKKGEVAVVYDPSVAGDRKIRLKVGDGVAQFTELPFIADYDAAVAVLENRLSVAESDISDLKNDLAEEIARVDRLLAEKVDTELAGVNGTSYIFNEKDGGGSKFVDNSGAAVYVGTHDNIGGVAGVQIYADKDAAGSESTIIDVTKNGAYYTKGEILPGAQRDVEANEIATKGHVAIKVAEEIGKIKTWSYKVVDVLPEPSADCERIVYLVPKGDGKTGYKEYVCINEGSAEVPVWKFEEIGDTDIDLSNYYTKDEIDQLVDTLEAAIAEEKANRIAADENLQADIDAEEARAKTEEAKKVDRELIGANGKALIFNESDGGGAKFENNNGIESFVGVNDGSNGIVAQIYADKLVEGRWSGAKLDVTNEGMFYTVGDKSAAERDVADNEIATKGVVNDAVAGKADDFDILDGGSASDWAD